MRIQIRFLIKSGSGSNFSLQYEPGSGSCSGDANLRPLASILSLHAFVLSLHAFVLSLHDSVLSVRGHPRLHFQHRKLLNLSYCGSGSRPSFSLKCGCGSGSSFSKYWIRIRNYWLLVYSWLYQFLYGRILKKNYKMDENFLSSNN
jgi:hypothetical protein